jgi:ribonuclease Z
MSVRSGVREPRIVVSPGAAAAPTTAAPDPLTVNDLILRVWTGQANHRLLFDFGEDCLSALSPSEIRAIAALCLSHLHIDHVAGFDGFLRIDFARPDAPVLIYGPEGTTRAIHHRLRGVTWRRIAGQPGRLRVTDILQDRMVTTRLLTAPTRVNL